MQRVHSRKQLIRQLSEPRNVLSMNFNRSTMKMSKQVSKFSRRNTRMSIYEKRRETEMKVPSKELSKDEKTLVYYLVNLILFKQYNMANSLSEKHLLKMKNKCSDIFKANVRRLQALSIQYASLQAHK